MEYSGFGTGAVETTVSIKHSNGSGSPERVSAFAQGGPDMGLKMQWDGPSHLVVVYKANPALLYFQVVKTSGVEISVQNISPKPEEEFQTENGSGSLCAENGEQVIIQPYPGDNQNGHIEAWNGSQFVSDFFQPYDPSAPGGGIYPGPGYRKAEPDYSIYRPTPCPTSTPPPAPAEQNLINRILLPFGKVVL